MLGNDDMYYKMFDNKTDYECYIKRKRVGLYMVASDLYNKTAEDVLEMCGQTDSVPVDLKEILKKFDISAMPKDFSSIENDLENPNLHILGIYVSDDSSAAIFYNHKDIENSHRYRFTIAHEIAHCCLSGEKSHIEFRLDGIELDKEEIAANTFAGALLIPEKSLYSVLEELIVPSVHALADIFAVSENVMKARLKHLNVSQSILGYNY